MKYDKFFGAYKLTKPMAGELPLMRDNVAKKGISNLKVGVYNDGIYTIISREVAGNLLPLVESVFPYSKGQIDIIAVDWMGRVFAVDASEKDASGLSMVSCFDLAEPGSFCTDSNFDEFHEQVAVDRQYALLNMNQYEDWIKGNAPPSDGVSCVGYKVPLFLGGEDCLDNQELLDRSVYLHILAELYQSVQNPSQDSE